MLQHNIFTKKEITLNKELQALLPTYRSIEKLFQKTRESLYHSLRKNEDSKKVSPTKGMEYPQILADRNVLILEDDSCIQSLLECFLEMYGAKVSLACTTQEATQTFSKLLEKDLPHPPLIITDGRINGDHTKTVDTMMAIKKLMPETKILLFTGLYKEFILEGIQEQEGKKIFDFYLQKPANMTLLLGAIRALAGYTEAQ